MSKTHFSATAEALEPRRLFSGVALTDSVIVVTGTTGDDSIVLALDTKKHLIEVNFNGQSTWYPQSAVTSVSAKLDIGNDKFDAATLAIPLIVDGEAGNDTIIGGAGNDWLIGGLDNDSLAGNEGSDSLSGSGGKDILEGGPAADRLDGGKGNDILHGGSSNDRLIGGEGSDQIYGDGGNDRFYAGGIYQDFIYGGTGTDTAYADNGDVLASIEIFNLVM